MPGAAAADFEKTDGSAEMRDDMKAIMVEEPFKVTVVDVEKPEIKADNEVLIKIKCVGICGSDIGIYKGTKSLATYPRIIGHEYGGQVVEVGSAVTNVKVGDYVSVDPVRSCGHCYACKINRHNVCTTLEVTGVHQDGGCREYVVAPAADVYRIDVNKIDKDLICLTEPYSIGVQVNHRADVHEGDKVLVMGSGPIGLTVMQVAKSRGAQVMMTDLVDARLERAKEMGADIVVNVSKEDLKQAVLDFTDGEGMPVVVDSVCSLTSVPEAMDLACPAGRVVTLGLINKPSEIAQVDFTKKELTVVGSRLSNYRFPEVIEGFESGALTPDKIRTHSFPAEKAEEAMKLNMEHPDQVCKITLTFD